MGAIWYSAYSTFGYVVKVPSSNNYCSKMSYGIKLRKKLNDAIKLLGEDYSHIKLHTILSDFHSRMEYDDPRDMDYYITIIIGFSVYSMDLDNISKKADLLNTFIQSNAFTELEADIDRVAIIRSGIEWGGYGEDEDYDSDCEPDSD